MPPSVSRGRAPKQIRVWGELGVTVNLGEFNSVRVTIGHERICDDNDEAIADAEEAINSFNSEAVAARVDDYKKLQIEDEDDDSAKSSRSRRGRN